MSPAAQRQQKRPPRKRKRRTAQASDSSSSTSTSSSESSSSSEEEHGLQPVVNGNHAKTGSVQNEGSSSSSSTSDSSDSDSDADSDSSTSSSSSSASSTSTGSAMSTQSGTKAFIRREIHSLSPESAMPAHMRNGGPIEGRDYDVNSLKEFWMAHVAETFADDLELLRQDSTLNQDKTELLVQALEDTMGVMDEDDRAVLSYALKN